MSTKSMTDAERLAALQAQTARHLRKLFKLVGRVRLAPTGPVGVRPELSPADLWRAMPGLVGGACDLAEACGGADPDEIAFVRGLGQMIDQSRCPRG